MLTRVILRRAVFLGAFSAGIACGGGLVAAGGKAEDVPATPCRPKPRRPAEAGTPAAVPQYIILDAASPAGAKAAAAVPQYIWTATIGHVSPVAAKTVAGVPRELAMRSLPTYRISPPDIIQIEMLKLVPLPPYRAAVFDVLQIHVANTLPDQPIDNYYMIEAEGTINLGPAYGPVRVAGMTLDEAKHAIEKKLAAIIKKPPEVAIQLARVSGAQPVTGQYLIGPDGTVNLRTYGLVHLAGKTVTEARLALQKHLEKFLASPELSVDVVAYNSKVYYVVTQGAGQGDTVRRLPVTGNETVLDALANVNGLSQLSSKRIWIARPSVAHADKGTTLPVDWDAIVQRGATATNYQIMPGDRIFIAEDRDLARNNDLNKKTARWERVLGLIGLVEADLRGLLLLEGR